MSNKEKVLKALSKGSNWRPDLTRISKETGVPISSVHDVWMKIQQRTLELNVNIDITINLEFRDEE